MSTVKRDPTLQPRIDAPAGIQPSLVRNSWPGAVEALELRGDQGVLTVQNGRLWFEHDVPTPVLVWDPIDRSWKAEP